MNDVNNVVCIHGNYSQICKDCKRLHEEKIYEQNIENAERKRTIYKFEKRKVLKDVIDIIELIESLDSWEFSSTTIIQAICNKYKLDIELI
jgi:hypothetical protein